MGSLRSTFARFVRRSASILNGVAEKFDDAANNNSYIVKEIAKRQQIVAYRTSQYAPHYEEQKKRIQDTLEAQNFIVPLCAYEMLVDHKAGDMRKNNYEPDHSHETDQLLPIVTKMEHNEFPIEQIDAFHGEGTSQSILIAKAFHDIGEDEGLFYSDVTEDLRARVKAKLGCKDHQDLPEDIEALIHLGGKDMEWLTHYRDFSLEKFREVTKDCPGEPLSFTDKQIESMRTGKPIDLREQYNDFFWKKINCFDPEDEATNEHMQVFARWSKKKNRPEIIVTQYGLKDSLGVSWNLYINRLSRYIRLMMVKTADRGLGVATRFGTDAPDNSVMNFDLDGHDKYLDETNQLWRMSAQILLTAEQFQDSPLLPYLRAENASLINNYTFARSYVDYHPLRNKPGEKVLDPHHVDEHSFYISRNFSKEKEGDTNLLYSHVPTLSHPAYKLMQQLADVTGQNLTRGHRRLWYGMIKVWIDEGGKNIERVLGPLRDKKGDPPPPEFLASAPSATHEKPEDVLTA